MSYGTEIARVNAHSNGFTVETKTKKRPKPANHGSKDSSPLHYDSQSGPLDGHDWETSIAKSTNEVHQRVGAAIDLHKTESMRQQKRGLDKAAASTATPTNGKYVSGGPAK